MKEYVINITNNRAYGFDAATLCFREDGKKIILKPGDKAETKMKGKNISGKRLKIINEKGDIYGRGKKGEKLEFKIEKTAEEKDDKKKKKGDAQ